MIVGQIAAIKGHKRTPAETEVLVRYRATRSFSALVLLRPWVELYIRVHGVRLGQRLRCWDAGSRSRDHNELFAGVIGVVQRQWMIRHPLFRNIVDKSQLTLLCDAVKAVEMPPGYSLKMNPNAIYIVLAGAWAATAWVYGCR